MTLACDERSPCRGGEKEEPNEPSAPSSSEEKCSGKVRVVEGIRALPFIETDIKTPFYEYNEKISKYGYLVKPVHRVYKRKRVIPPDLLSPEKIIIYSYYGRYWWKRQGKRLIYVGTKKPSIIPFEPPENELGGRSIIIDERDIIIDCDIYKKYKKYLKGFEIRTEY